MRSQCDCRLGPAAHSSLCLIWGFRPLPPPSFTLRADAMWSRHHGMANQQRCLAKPRGEPCTNPRQTQHPCMAELRNCICFGCCEWLLVRWVSAWLAAAGVPLVSVNSAKDRFSLPADYQHPTSPVLCAFCTQPANGDEPLLECRGLRDGTACELAWHESCHQAVSGTAGPPPDSKFQCCTGWMARAEIDPKDRFCQPTTRYRKGLAKRGSLGPKGSAHGATAKVSAATTADASTAAAAANAPVPDVAAQPPATPASSSSAPPAEVTPPAGLPSTSLLTPHTSTGAARGPAVNSPAADAANADAAVDNGGADANGDAGSGWEDDPTRTGLLTPQHAPHTSPRAKPNVWGVDWKSTAVDASRFPPAAGAQCFVFLAVLRDPCARGGADPSGTFGDVWLLGTDGVAPKQGLELAVKTPRPITEPEGDNESATRERAEAQARAGTRLRWEARATPSIFSTHPAPLPLPRRPRAPSTHTYCDRYTLHSVWQALILKELRAVPNIVQLLGYDCRVHQLYLPRLRPLANYLEHGFRRASAGHKSSFLRAVIHGVLDGVAQLHKHGVCHRDLKIDNVLIAGSLPPGAGQRTAWAPCMMSAQLCDFGYSLMTGVNEDVDEARRLNPGTPPYIAPEVYAAREAAKADEVGAVPCGLDRQGWQQADVYSATMMVWGLCHANITPFFPRVDNSSQASHIKEKKLEKLIVRGERPRLDQEVDPGLQPLWDKLALPDSPLARAWSHDPKERPTAAELQQGILELDDTLEGGGGGDGGGGGGGDDGDGDGGGDETTAKAKPASMLMATTTTT